MQSNSLVRGVYLRNGSLVIVVWPGNRKWVINHGRRTTLLESVASLQGLLAALRVYRRNAFVIMCDHDGSCHSFRKGHSLCSFVLTVLKAMEDVSVGTMSRVTVRKTRRCSGFGELVADKIVKGDVHLFPYMGFSVDNWL